MAKLKEWIFFFLILSKICHAQTANTSRQNNKETLDSIHKAYSNGELNYKIVKAYLDSLSDDELFDSTNFHLIYDFAVYKDTNYLDIRSNSFRFLIKNKERFNKVFDSTPVNIRIAWAALLTARKAIEGKNKLLLAEAIEILKPFENMPKNRFGRIQYISSDNTKKWIDIKWQSLRLWLKYYHKMNDWDVYNKLEKEYTQKHEKKNMEAMMVLCWDYYKEFSNKGEERKYLIKALYWCADALKLDNYQVMDKHGGFHGGNDHHGYSHYVQFIYELIRYKLEAITTEELVKGIFFIPDYKGGCYMDGDPRIVNAVEDLSVLFSDKDKHDKTMVDFIKKNILNNPELTNGNLVKEMKEKYRELVTIMESSK